MQQFFPFNDDARVTINDGGIDLSAVPPMDFTSQNPKFKNLQRGVKTKKMKKLSLLPSGKYTAHPTGALHRLKEYHDLGPIFPYVLNVKKGKHLKIRVTRNQYPCLAIQIGAATKLDYAAHEIFAILFIKNLHPSIFCMVDHGDDDKLNYQISNLSWVTQSYNQKKAFVASKDSTDRILSIGSHRIKYRTSDTSEELCDYMI
jgi:hypothetical protein